MSTKTEQPKEKEVKPKNAYIIPKPLFEEVRINIANIRGLTLFEHNQVQDELERLVQPPKPEKEYESTT